MNFRGSFSIVMIMNIRTVTRITTRVLLLFVNNKYDLGKNNQGLHSYLGTIQLKHTKTLILLRWAAPQVRVYLLR